MLAIIMGFVWLPMSAQAIEDYIEAEEFSASASPTAGEETYRQAAQQGDVLAQLNLGAMYYYGLGTAKNYTKSLFWYRKAADQGEPLAQFKLAVMLAEGLGGTRDLTAAAQWFRQVAVRTRPLDSSTATDIIGWSQLKLGFLYKEGTGVVKDLAQSALWFRMAAARGYASAQFQLGQLALQEGKDKVEALKWFKMAAAQGQTDAVAAVASLEKQLAPDQVTTATAMASKPVAPVVAEASGPLPEQTISPPSVATIPKRKEPQTTSVPPGKTVGKSIYPLTVETDPPNAQVQILNITPPYYPGMALEPGRYHIKITQDGFESQQRWVTLDNAPLRVPMKLTANRPAVVAEKPQPAPKPQPKVTPKPEPEPAKPPPEKPELFSVLHVRPDPADASVRIVNVREPYHPGMRLKAGRYLVEVSRSGYKTASRWMRLPGGGEFEISAPLEPN
ncbi:MAG: SEL1-like repeat protein [Magnetococcales bacterium]|nr:SEL1-like repeat protein [Magnetococcales bacterium]MBF0439901.1 SEL1-like repeat protein [Magnetococcales bacterium]